MTTHQPITPLKGFNAFQIKLFMAILMVLDHIPHIPGLVPPALEGILHVLTRCVAPWFAYLTVEGFLHTRSRLRYNIRLFFWAAAMILGNLIYNHFGAPYGLTLNNNIFLTLALGVLMLNILVGDDPVTEMGRCFRSNREWTLRILGTVLVMVVSLFSEGGILLLPFILITYLGRHRIRLRNGLYLLLSIALFLLVFRPYATVEETLLALAAQSDFLFLSVLPVLSLYNGTRGPNTDGCKYFFYLFYPLHLWLIGILAFWFL